MNPESPNVMDKLVSAAAGFPRIPSPVAEAYAACRETLVGRVRAALAEQPDLEELLGGNPRQVMDQELLNHARFMANVFRFNQVGLLLRTVPWAYRTYHAQGFLYAYFSRQFDGWLKAVADQLEPEHAGPVLDAYRWLRSHHDLLVGASKLPEATQGPQGIELDPGAGEFLGALLAGETQEATRLANRAVRRAGDIERLYLGVIQPCLYQVGALWAKGDISVAHEHLATAVCLRIMTGLYTRLIDVEPYRGLVVVTAAPGEQHDLGARMVADLLEIDGWEVDYLGADTPGEDLCRLLADRGADLLAISVTMPFNLDGAARMVAGVRQNAGAAKPRIMVGGGLLTGQPDLWETIGADGWAANAREAVALARRWFPGERPQPATGS